MQARPAMSPYLSAGLALSALLHILFAATLITIRPTDRSLELPIMVNLESLPLPSPRETRGQTQQIVSPPQQKAADKEPENARFLSDQNFVAGREQIKRGAPDSGLPGDVSHPAPPPQPANQPGKEQKADQPKPSDQRPASKQAQGGSDKESSDKPQPFPLEGRQAHPVIPDRLALKLDPETARQKFGEERGQARPDPLRSSTQTSTPFSRPSGTGARFLGLSGTSDHLPFLPDGDITLLNAKANQFAVFVRRVAVRVFSELRSSGWERLSAADVRAIGQDCTVVAHLSLKGDLLSVKLEDESGSHRFDSVLAAAVQRGARDPNPPEAAANSEGTIGFIFKSRSWVQMGSDAKTGAPLERRWLLLSTGLE